MSLFRRRNKTNFSGGDLTIEYPPLSQMLQTPNFVAPRKLDFRDMCIKTSNQMQTPHCAGYSTAGFVEVNNWKTNHIPKQYDGDAIYEEAKEKFDTNSGDGTTLQAAMQAAISLGYISGEPKYINTGKSNIQYAVHEYLGCVAGFAITNEWNSVSVKTGRIADYGDSAKDLGGHAVLICGYDSDGVYIQNSWGSAWGLYGFGLISWPQVTRQFMYGMVVDNLIVKG